MPVFLVGLLVEAEPCARLGLALAALLRVWPVAVFFWLRSYMGLRRAMVASVSFGREVAACQELIGLDVTLACDCHDIVWQRRCGRRLVPAGLREPVAHELLVEAGLTMA